jgi:6-phospho-beta-glucosidase
MKLCILGGGGFRTPYVYQALLRDGGSPRITEVVLYDVDEDRLRSMTIILGQFAVGFDDAPKLVPTTSLRSAIEGSDFVFAAIRVGGLEGRRCDEHVALDLDVIGQETIGPGGLAYAIRTVPVMMEVAHLVQELAPQAYLMNFTNPAGIITEAMQSVLGDRVLGICDTPSGLGRRVAGMLGLDHTRVQMDYVGLNHLGWLRRVMYNGTDVLPRLLDDETLLGQMEEAEVFGTDWIQALGVVPNEYLYYYYFNRDAVRKINAAGETRGDFLARTQTEFFDAAQAAGDGAAELWRETVDARSASYMAEAKGGVQGAAATHRKRESDPDHQGYAGVALGVMAAITRNERATMILNVRNGTTLTGLPTDAVVEVPTMVDANGVHPLTTTQPSLDQLGLMQQVKAVERHTIAAALTGSKDEALLAFALHPLVDSVSVARDLLTGYIGAIPEVAKVLEG